MPNDRLPNDKPDMLDKLFGDPTSLSDDDLNLLFETIAPGEDPSQAIHRMAENAAVAYRKKNQVPPDHVQAALQAARHVTSLDQASPSLLQQIANKLASPVLGPVNDPAFSDRNRAGDLNESDKAVINELTKDL